MNIVAQLEKSSQLLAQRYSAWRICQQRDADRVKTERNMNGQANFTATRKMLILKLSLYKSAYKVTAQKINLLLT